MTKKEAYAILGLPEGVTWDEIKSRQRELVKTTHPDRFQDAAEQEAAHHKTADINRAVQYLKRLHRAGALRTGVRKTHAKTAPAPAQAPAAPEVPKAPPEPAAPRSAPGAARASEGRSNAAYEQWAARKKRNAPDAQALEERFSAHKSRVTARYAGQVREPVYHRFFRSTGGVPGAPDSPALYERYVEFRKIQDRLFYAINIPFNVVLKYVLLFVSVILIIRSVLGHFYAGRLVYQPELFVAKVLWLGAAFFVLSLSDLGFRMAITYRFGRLNHPFYDDLKRRGRFSGTMGRSFLAFLALKYAVALTLLRQFFAVSA